MKDIKILRHKVTRADPNIEVMCEGRYMLKGLGKEQAIKNTVMEVSETLGRDW